MIGSPAAGSMPSSWAKNLERGVLSGNCLENNLLIIPSPCRRSRHLCGGEGERIKSRSVALRHPIIQVFIQSGMGRFALIREYGMPLPLFNIEIRITGSRSGKSDSEGETIRAQFTPTRTLPHQGGGRYSEFLWLGVTPRYNDFECGRLPHLRPFTRRRSRPSPRRP